MKNKIISISSITLYALENYLKHLILINGQQFVS